MGHGGDWEEGGLNYKGAKGMTVFGGPCKKTFGAKQESLRVQQVGNLGGGRGGHCRYIMVAPSL